MIQPDGRYWSAQFARCVNYGPTKHDVATQPGPVLRRNYTRHLTRCWAQIFKTRRGCHNNNDHVAPLLIPAWFVRGRWFHIDKAAMHAARCLDITRAHHNGFSLSCPWLDASYCQVSLTFASNLRRVES